MESDSNEGAVRPGQPSFVNSPQTQTHNLIRWSANLGDFVEEETLVVARTLRTRYFSVPGRLVNLTGTPTLRGPTNWPWATCFTGALTDLRAVAFVPT